MVAVEEKPALKTRAEWLLPNYAIPLKECHFLLKGACMWFLTLPCYSTAYISISSQYYCKASAAPPVQQNFRRLSGLQKKRKWECPLLFCLKQTSLLSVSKTSDILLIIADQSKMLEIPSCITDPKNTTDKIFHNRDPTLLKCRSSLIRAKLLRL